MLDALFERLGIGDALRTAAAGRRLDPEAVERILFALIAQRALEPASKLAATRWVAERVAIERCPAFDEDAAYRAMDFLLAALPEIAAAIFARTANLLEPGLRCDLRRYHLDLLRDRRRRCERARGGRGEARPTQRAARRRRPSAASPSTPRTSAPIARRW